MDLDGGQRVVGRGVMRWGKKEGSVFVRFRGSEFYIYEVIFYFLYCKTVQLLDQKSSHIWYSNLGSCVLENIKTRQVILSITYSLFK